MSLLRVRLFGKFEACYGERVLVGLDAPKVQELFSYLLLYRDRPHSRETLSDLFWCDDATLDPRKCLRQVLWRLQAAVDSQSDSTDGSLLLIDSKWVQLNRASELWADVIQFEQAFALVQRTPGQELQEQGVQTLRAALQLYRGHLLEGCYEDWCLFERGRLQSMYLSMLEKLMIYYEAQGEYEAGLECGICILRLDAAHERTHRRLMRLHYQLGNRTAALRQYKICVAALRQELNADPSGQTVAVHEQIRSGWLSGQAASQATATLKQVTPTLRQTLAQLEMLQTTLVKTEDQLQQVIQLVEMALERST